MRYRGQGHEVTVTIPADEFTTAGRADLVRLFEQQYAVHFGRNIPGLAIEVLSWALRLAAASAPAPPCPPSPADRAAKPQGRGHVADPATGGLVDVPIYRRPNLAPGDVLAGPALISEDETTTVVTEGFVARINGLGHIVLTRT